MNTAKNYIPAALCALLLFGCAQQRKLREISTAQMSAQLSLPAQNDFAIPALPDVPKQDTLKIVDDDGTELYVMRAILDEDGNSVANEVLDAAVVTATFRNVAERHGRVTLAFNLHVPASMQDSRWQLRFYPHFIALDDTLHADHVLLTGRDYRRTQMKGYQRYNRFVASIVTDSTYYIDYKNLNLFLQRNLPRVYAYKMDTTIVSEYEFATAYGVTEQQALDHYTRTHAKELNARKRAKMYHMFNKYVKSPIVEDGIRIDAVLPSDRHDFDYLYEESIETRPTMKKVLLYMDGGIFEEDRLLYTIPPSDALTFYISSLSSFAEDKTRYLTKVVERRVEANTSCRVEFASASDRLDERLGDNASEMGRIKGNIRDLLLNEKFDLDSVVITGAASPEGRRDYNEKLSLRRAHSLAFFFSDFTRTTQDSIRRAHGAQLRAEEAERGVQLAFEDGDSVADSLVRADRAAFERRRDSLMNVVSVPYIAGSRGENWDVLDDLVAMSVDLTDKEREDYFHVRGKVKDLDACENALHAKPYYQRLKTKVYPGTRAVYIDFHLHRKGMVKDTVHTTVVDSVYMEGVQCIHDMDYARAAELLAPYRDYNSAVAYTLLDKNHTALEILDRLERTAPVNYIYAILYSRIGREKEAVECYLKSVKQDPAYKHRGNLDPEVSVLIKRFNLNKEDDAEFDALLQ